VGSENDLPVDVAGNIERVADPFSVFLAVHRRNLPPTRGKRFNSGEHVWLGGAGAERAREEVQQALGVPLRDDLFTSIRRRVAREELQYGEIVALSGDFYESPEALFEEKPAALPWFSGQANISGLRDVFNEELRWIEDSQHGRAKVSYPEDNIRMAWSAKSYVELALRNVDHFGWHNMRAYVRHHGEALRLAAAARGQDDETFRRALYTNAFADHFLTDGFAAGHIRVPRAEILAWAERNGLNDKVAGALSKVLHDQDGHVDVRCLHGVDDENARSPDDGLGVQDSTSTKWFARCDGQLFLQSPGSVAVDRAVAAVTASVGELLFAWLRGEQPRTLFEATRYVPFPRPDLPSLSEKFSASMLGAERDMLWRSVAWYSKIPWISGLSRRHLDDLLEALPDLMKNFREQVAADVVREPESIARIAPPYVAAYACLA
jgi:hypothetical protein